MEPAVAEEEPVVDDPSSRIETSAPLAAHTSSP